jgi:hypothetical protein
MPDHYVKPIIDNNPNYCVGESADRCPITKFAHTLGFCKSMDEFKMRKDKDGIPLLEDCKKRKFSFYTVTKEVMTLYRGFYANKEGSRDAFIAFWEKIGQRLGHNKYVMGYDP